MAVKPDLLPYHTSTGGAAVVGDGKSTITYNEYGAVINRLSENTTTTVYVPLSNPPTKPARLQRVQVECTGSYGGAITEVWVSYSNCNVLRDRVEAGNADFEIWPTSTQQFPDSKPYGINVALVVSLPHEISNLGIYSVALGFNDQILEGDSDQVSV